MSTNVMVLGQKTGRRQHRMDGEGSHAKERGGIRAGRPVKGVRLVPKLRGD